MVPERGLHPNSRHHDILADPDVRRWHSNLEQASGHSAQVQRNHLARFLKAVGHSAKGYLKLPKKVRADVLQDYVTQELGKGLAGGYVKGYPVAVQSWLRHNGQEVGRRINIRGTNVKTRTTDAKIPSPEELAETMRLAGPHISVRIAIMATSGVRPEVLGHRKGLDGLMVADIPDLNVANGEISWSQVPARINVRPELSKTGKGYFTFIGPLACAYVKKDLEVRMAKGEAVDPASPIASATIRTARKFVSTGNLTKQIRDAMRKAGLMREPPYIWRSYFSNRCLAARMNYEWREFMLGHTGGIAGIYSMGKHIPDDMVEAMRKEYQRACRFLEPQGASHEEDSTLAWSKEVLVGAGCTEGEVADLDPDGLSQREILDLIRGRLLKPAESVVAKQRQKAIPPEELEGALKDGYGVKMQLHDGRILVELPQPA